MSEWVVEIVDGLPHTKSMKPLVRCKDCKFWIDERCEKFKRFTDEDFYCADGKRR